MKFSNKPLFVCLASASLFLLVISVGCKKSNSSSSGNGQISATVNGTAWASNLAAPSVYASAVDQFEILGGEVKSGDTTAMGVSFFTPFPLNTLISSDTSGLDVEYLDAKTQAEYDGSSLSGGGHSLLTVTAYDSTNHKITGTFSGVLYNISGGSDSLVVTKGTFNTTYTPE